MGESKFEFQGWVGESKLEFQGGEGGTVAGCKLRNLPCGGRGMNITGTKHCLHRTDR